MQQAQPDKITEIQIQARMGDELIDVNCHLFLATESVHEHSHQEYGYKKVGNGPRRKMTWKDVQPTRERETTKWIVTVWKI